MLTADKLARLLAGEEVVSREPGNSMTPRIFSRQPVLLSPISWAQCQKGDVVYCKVRGNHYTHLVLAVNAERGCLIGNNHGRTNGWTKKVYARVKAVYPSDWTDEKILQNRGKLT